MSPFRMLTVPVLPRDPEKMIRAKTVFQMAEAGVEKDRSVWASTTPEDIKKVYGRAFHPFAEKKQFGTSE